MLLLALLAGVGLAQQQYAGYTYSKGACRGGQSPGNNAGLKFFRNRSCKTLCDSQATCTGFVLPVTNSNWCETYTSKGARGDNRNFYCYMKNGQAGGGGGGAGKCTGPQSCAKYNYSKGACRGGNSPGANAGLKFYSNRNCEALCDSQATCTGFVLPMNNSNWCETYTSKNARGDGRNYYCYMKKTQPNVPTIKPTAPPSLNKPGYTYSKGACRGGQSPGANAGLKFFANRNCQALCNSQATCTGFVLPVNNSNWCETYTSKGARGDNRNFHCWMKNGNAGPAPTQPPVTPSEYVRSEGACRGGLSPGANAGLKFYSNRGCRALCDRQAACTGYVLPKNNSNWCETYTSKQARGDGRTTFWCYMKTQHSAPPTPAPTAPNQEGYTYSKGACRGGQSPGGNAGLKFFSNRNCKALCDSQATCTGFVLPINNSNWCETYTSKGAKGDGRNYYCFMKKPPTPVDCEVSAFGAWGECSEECGGGVQTRTRTVTKPAQHGGDACPALSEEQACNEEACVETGSMEKTIGSVTEDEAGSSAGSVEEAFGSMGIETTVTVSSVSSANRRRRLQDGELGDWVVEYEFTIPEGKSLDEMTAAADDPKFNSAMLADLEESVGREVTLPGAELESDSDDGEIPTFADFKEFKDWCAAYAKEDGVSAADACKLCVGKYKKNKCKLPKKAKKVKCKKIKNMDMCMAVGCGERKGKCNGKPGIK